MLRFFVSIATLLAILFGVTAARADKVVVLPFDAPRGASRPELDEVRRWARDAVVARGHSIPNPTETAAAEAAVKDGVADTSSEYRAAGRAASAQWTVSGHAERRDVAPVKLADGTEEEGYTQWRVELEVCQVESGRVETLVREVDPDEAPAQIAEMLALLVRPEGVANAPIPWEQGAHKPRVRAKPKAPPPAPPPPPPPPAEPPAPVVKHVYGENRPAALGVSVGYSGALSRPDNARGPSSALALGAAFGYALEQVPGLELRAAFTSQVVGPKAIAVGAGARYAIPVLPQYRVFVGPELLAGAHVAIGAEKTARFLAQGSVFASVGLGDAVQVEISGDLAPALGGSGTLLLGGATARLLYRF